MGAEKWPPPSKKNVTILLPTLSGNSFYLCESDPLESMNQSSCPSQTGSVTPRIIDEPEITESTQTETASTETAEYLGLISKSADGHVCRDLVIQLIGK